MALSGSGSHACNPLNLICNKYKVSKYELMKHPWGCYVGMFSEAVVDHDVNVMAGAIADLVYIRDTRSAPGFTYDDCVIICVPHNGPLTQFYNTAIFTFQHAYCNCTMSYVRNKDIIIMPTLSVQAIVIPVTRIIATEAGCMLS